ncbi:hypothetical protein [Streptomyces sp. NPDC057582]|uniref:hypothetical protein n=1 Tax=unclassified Streptomyces TaxID=2593676 RepID=UPI0036BEE5E6
MTDDNAADVRAGPRDAALHLPVGLKALGFTPAAETTPESVRPMFDMLVGGALIAAAAVLPAMREAHDGALLFTTGTIS